LSFGIWPAFSAKAIYTFNLIPIFTYPLAINIDIPWTRSNRRLHNKKRRKLKVRWHSFFPDYSSNYVYYGNGML
jgi:hypothetical protein